MVVHVGFFLEKRTNLHEKDDTPVLQDRFLIPPPRRRRRVRPPPNFYRASRRCTQPAWRAQRPTTCGLAR